MTDNLFHKSTETLLWQRWQQHAGPARGRGGRLLERLAAAGPLAVGRASGCGRGGRPAAAVARSGARPGLRGDAPARSGILSRLPGNRGPRRDPRRARLSQPPTAPRQVSAGSRGDGASLGAGLAVDRSGVGTAGPAAGTQGGEHDSRDLVSLGMAGSRDRRGERTAWPTITGSRASRPAAPASCSIPPARRGCKRR